MQTAKEKAEELMEKFRKKIGESDFHVPEFISGVPMADGGVEYKKVYEEEEASLAQECALIAVEEIIEEANGYFDLGTPFVGHNDRLRGKSINNQKRIAYWCSVKSEIENL